MAYISDPRSLRFIDFQPVRMIDRPRMSNPPMTAFGADPPGYVPFTSVPAETSHPYATMAVCDVQRHLIAAGNPRLKPDGAWGTASKTAFLDWARHRPLAEARTVMASGDALPTFGMRADYKFDGQKIRIPAVYAMSLPPMANVPCSSRIAPSRDAAPPGEDVVPGADADILPGAAMSKTPWVAIGVATGAALLIGFLMFKSKKEPK